MSASKSNKRNTAILNDMVFKIKSDFLKALAHPIRLEVIECLKNGEVSVGGIVQRLGVEQSNLSRHLSILREVGILNARQNGTTVNYSIHDRDVFKVLRPISLMLKKKLMHSEKILEKLGLEQK